MDAKQTAQDIERKYLTIIVEELLGGDSIFMYTAKNCAKAEVKAIIENDPINPPPIGYYETLQDRIDYAILFWNEVLREIDLIP